MTSNQPDILASTLISRPGLKRIKVIATTTNFIFGFIMFVGIYGMISSLANAQDYPYLTLAIVGLVGEILVLSCFSMIAKCPKCRKRVVTLKLWADGAMPLRGKKECPFCKHPVDRPYSVSKSEASVH